MEITVTEIGPSKKNVKISISKEEVQEKYKEKVNELRTNSPIKGFRPGRVPDHIVEKKFGKNIAKELKRTFLVEGYQKAIEEHKLQPLGDPDINEEKLVLEKDKECVIEFALEVLPDFKLEYKELEVKLPNIRISPKEMDIALKQLRKMRGEWIVAKDGISEEGDQVICDVNLKVKNEMVWGKQNFELEIQDFKIMEILIGKKLLLGKKVGDVAKKEITLPQDFRISEYSEQKAEISFGISEIKKVNLPELDDEFAQEIGSKDLPDLKSKLREQIKSEKQAGQNQQIERELMNSIVKTTEITLPKEFIKTRVAQTNETMRNKLKKEGKSDAKIKAQIEKNKEKTKENVIGQLKEYLIIEKIAREEKIEISDEDMDEYINQVAAQNKKWPNEVREEFEQKEMLEEIKYQLKTGKVLTFLREHAKMV